MNVMMALNVLLFTVGILVGVVLTIAVAVHTLRKDGK